MRIILDESVPQKLRLTIEGDHAAETGGDVLARADVLVNFWQTGGASWREILDVADWDRSVITNVPGESGDTASTYFGDLLQDWAIGRCHSLPFSRKAVEAALHERIVLEQRCEGRAREGWARLCFLCPITSNVLI